jgi:hypothetical protein
VKVAPKVCAEYLRSVSAQVCPAGAGAPPAVEPVEPELVDPEPVPAPPRVVVVVEPPAPVAPAEPPAEEPELNPDWAKEPPLDPFDPDDPDDPDDEPCPDAPVADDVPWCGPVDDVDGEVGP